MIYNENKFYGKKGKLFPANKPLESAESTIMEFVITRPNHA
jgi:hypothetical protein